MIGKVEKIERGNGTITLTIQLNGEVTLDHATIKKLKVSMSEEDYKAHGEPKEGDEFKPGFTFFQPMTITPKEEI